MARKISLERDDKKTFFRVSSRVGGTSRCLFEWFCNSREIVVYADKKRLVDLFKREPELSEGGAYFQEQPYL